MYRALEQHDFDIPGPDKRSAFWAVVNMESGDRVCHNLTELEALSLAKEYNEIIFSASV